MSTSHYHIVFLGAPQAGKSTLMAAWYYLARRVYNAQPELDYQQTAEFLTAYERWEAGESLDPTNRGEHFSIRLRCRKRSRKFTLELSDFSGEDILNYVDQVETNDTDSRSDVEQSLQAVAAQADWIIYACDPERLVHGSPEDQNNALHLAKLLPNSIGNERTSFHRITNGYFSRADLIDNELLERANQIIADSPDLEYLDEFHFGSATIGHLAEKNDQNGLQTFFNQVMTELLSGSSSPLTRKKRFLSLPSLAIAVLIVPLLWLAISAFTSPHRIDSWEKQAEKFQRLCQEAESVEGYDEAQSLLQELKSWQASAEPEDADRFSTLQPELEKVRQQLKRFSPPQGSGKIVEELLGILGKHGGRQKNFYQELISVAGRQASSPDYTREAQKQWRELQTFAEALLNQGTQISITSSWIEGPQWWSSYWGTNELELEIWVVAKGSPKPYGKLANGERHPNRKFNTGFVEPYKTQNDYVVNWTQKGELPNVRLDDDIWIRVVESESWNETLFDYRLKRGGPLGLDQLKEKSLFQPERGRPYRLTLGARANRPTPSLISRAFEQYEARLR